jgi:hypothetical protein
MPVLTTIWSEHSTGWPCFRLSGSGSASQCGASIGEGGSFLDCQMGTFSSVRFRRKRPSGWFFDRQKSAYGIDRNRDIQFFDLLSTAYFADTCEDCFP